MHGPSYIQKCLRTMLDNHNYIAVVLPVTQGPISHNYIIYFNALTKFKCDLTLHSMHTNSDVFELGCIHN
jgi:hypothetical protein